MCRILLETISDYCFLIKEDYAFLIQTFTALISSRDSDPWAGHLGTILSQKKCILLYIPDTLLLCLCYNKFKYNNSCVKQIHTESSWYSLAYLFQKSFTVHQILFSRVPLNISSSTEHNFVFLCAYVGHYLQWFFA